MIEIIMMIHVLFGMLVIVTSVWVFVDVLNISEGNQGRIKAMSLGILIMMWLAFLFAGYWYVVYYGTDKAIILKGQWPFAHTFFMEMKEHVVIMLLLLSTYLPIAAFNNLLANKAAKKVVLWVTGLIVLIGLAMDGTGAIIAMGVKVALLPK